MVARVTAARRRIGAGSRRPAERFQRGASLAGRRSRGRARSTSCASVGLEAAGRSTAVFGSRAASKLLVCGGSRLRTGLPRLERLREKTEGRQRAGGDECLTEGLVFGAVLRPPCPRGGAFFRGRARNHPISPPPGAARDAPRRRIGLGDAWATDGGGVGFYRTSNCFLRTRDLGRGLEACLVCANARLNFWRRKKQLHASRPKIDPFLLK